MDGVGLATTVDWARYQFALTAMYHWIFVPITLGLSFLCAFFETLYVRSGKEEWKNTAKFWMKLFGINFAVGVATGIIMEFEFGTNWSNYSWMVGDIFGAPLAIEGIVAFFLEATFFAVMFFGWDRVSKGFHLFSTWMVAIGSNLSALWILVANGWMQYPAGMHFNPETVRYEMVNFWQVLFSPVAMAKFTHTTSTSFIVGSLFVISVSSWYLLRGKHKEMARKSILVASVFGLVATIYAGITGDESAYVNAKTQPMKLAAYEGYYKGETNPGIIALGIINRDKKPGDNQAAFAASVKIPGVLGLMAGRGFDKFVPGIDDLVYGNAEQKILSAADKISRGKEAIADLTAYKEAKKAGDEAAAQASLAKFTANQEFMGYGYLQKAEDTVPPVALTFYSFHIMVVLGIVFLILFIVFLRKAAKNTLMGSQVLLFVGFISFFLAMIASQAGWIVAEVGRQPWAIQDMLPVNVATTNIGAASVQTTFFLFLVIFTVLLIAEIGIMTKQINNGPKEV
ncbi:MAG: cytochrome ubiquinol oxidase subunit I [Desulfobulbaceae bacterium]|jgi:cytochrome d ubiquinol oxidase subunit I|nr:cytochrome ubiquinol oxidase subunit I [Desulfobulbaceae bacterium]